MEDTRLMQTAQSEILMETSKGVRVLELIMKHGPISKGEITRRTGFNIVTVSNYVGRFLEEKIILKKGLDISTGGRRPLIVDINPKYGFVVGVDISTDALTAGISNFDCRAINKIRRPREGASLDNAIQLAMDMIRELVDNSAIDGSKFRAAAFGISGVVDEHSGTIRETRPQGTSSNILWLKNAVEERFGVPAYVYNDASLAAFAHKKLGFKEEDIRNLIYMYSDLGCGIITNGQIYLGSRGSAGEVQLNLREELTEPPSLLEERTHFLKTVGPALGIVQRARRLFEEGQDSEIFASIEKNPDNITIDNIIACAMRGDEIARDLIKEAGMNLGVKVAYLVNLFDPEVVVIGGGIEKAGEMILGPVKRMVKALSFENVSRSARIVPSTLGNDAVFTGALAIAIDNTLIKS